MRRIFLAVMMLSVSMFAFSVEAQNIELIGWYGWMDLTGDAQLADTDLDELDDIDIDFDSETGFGVGLNLFIGNRLSLQASAYRFEPEVAGTAGDQFAQLALGQLEVVPVSAVVQFHLFPGSRIDPYAGIGLGYVLLDDIETTDDLELIDLDRVELEDDYGIVYNAGVNIGLGSMFLALNIDAKYIPVDSAATAVFLAGPGQETEIEVNPLIVSAGLALQF